MKNYNYQVDLFDQADEAPTLLSQNDPVTLTYDRAKGVYLLERNTTDFIGDKPHESKRVLETINDRKELFAALQKHLPNDLPYLDTQNFRSDRIAPKPGDHKEITDKFTPQKPKTAHEEMLERVEALLHKGNAWQQQQPMKPVEPTGYREIQPLAEQPEEPEVKPHHCSLDFWQKGEKPVGAPLPPEEQVLKDEFDRMPSVIAWREKQARLKNTTESGGFEQAPKNDALDR